MDRANKRATLAAREGDVEGVRNMIKLGANDFNYIACGAAEGGHLDILYALVKKGADDWNWIAYNAALGGHIELVNKMVKMGATNHISISCAISERRRRLSPLLDY